MIRGFAAIRRRLLSENRFTRYLAYAAGSKGRAGRGDALKPADFAPLLSNLEARNGFWMTILEFDSMNGQMRPMRNRSRQLLADIDAELER